MSVCSNWPHAEQYDKMASTRYLFINLGENLWKGMKFIQSLRERFLAPCVVGHDNVLFADIYRDESAATLCKNVEILLPNGRRTVIGF